ncbi:sex peptide receptor-like [Mercenaria mercenaria]|uniref:sex peptide receptor-like n=1 Tax=Mercenaria mercenaria TaxID=6596 RepID=UPI00234EE9F0|nr:sex peptide receptor-like [Mercenaria mercenaria]
MENLRETVNTNVSLTANLTNVTTLSSDNLSYINEISTTAYAIVTKTAPLGQTTLGSTYEPDNGGENFYNDMNYSFDLDYDSEYIYPGYDGYMYPGYSFERPVYLFIWEILVIFVFLVNVIVISILLRRKMRNATHMILVAIAISDSLTGLVTLPSYIMVYQRYVPLSDYSDYVHENANLSAELNQTYYDSSAYYQANAATDGYDLSKSLCRGYMISKYFLSKSFHTVSIFLTLFLGIQRYVSVAFPFKSKRLFCHKKTFILCVVIFVLSPALHLYHLGNEKAEDGVCQWQLKERGCGGGCIHLWFVFLIGHLIPCAALLIFTGLFIRQLHLGERNLPRITNNASQLSRRIEENRRMFIIVTAVVIVFLIPEMPYCVFLLYNAVDKSVNKGRNIELETNRAIHMSYELLLVISFHANFYIYTFLNTRFRACLYRSFVKPVQRVVGNFRKLSNLRSSSTSGVTTRKQDCVSSKHEQELHCKQSVKENKAGVVETKFSVEIPQSSHPGDGELEELNEENK